MKTKLFILFIVISSLVKGQYTVLLNFDSTNGMDPMGSLTISGNKLYGMTAQGGASGSGVVFSIDTNGDGFKDLISLNDTNGANPWASLTLSGNKLYGMTQYGGAHKLGTIFSIDTNGTRDSDLWNFDNVPTNSYYESGNLTPSSSGKVLYGLGYAGGSLGYGVIFSIDTNGTRYTNIGNFDAFDGYYPVGSLTPSLSGNVLYGMTFWGGINGINGYGVVFSFNINNASFSVLLNFNDTNGARPSGSLILLGNRLYGMTQNGGADDSGVIFSIDTDGNGYKDLLDFNGTNGEYPSGSLTFFGGKLYGMTGFGGIYNDGVIFSIDTSGRGYKKLLDFNGRNGRGPYGDLTPLGNMLYGMAGLGGIYNDGVIFKIDTNATSTASINNLTVNMGAINVYPNPSNGVFTIQAKSEELGGKSIEVYNVLGEKVLNETLKQVQGDNTINLSNQPNGVYFYRVITRNGESIGSGKVIIQR